MLLELIAGIVVTLTALALVLIPLLHLGDKPQGQPVGAAAEQSAVQPGA